MKSSSRTLDELRFLLKERSEIELEYSKKLSKLSKISLGKEEIGALKNALDTIRNELEISAKSHAELAGVMKGGLENSVTEFQNRVNSARKQVSFRVWMTCFFAWRFLSPSSSLSSFFTHFSIILYFHYLLHQSRLSTASSAYHLFTQTKTNSRSLRFQS